MYEKKNLSRGDWNYNHWLYFLKLDAMDVEKTLLMKFISSIFSYFIRGSFGYIINKITGYRLVLVFI